MPVSDVNINLLEAPDPDPDPDPEPVQLRAFGDYPAARKAIYDRAFAQLGALPPASNATHTLRLKDVAWDGPSDFSKRDRKEAVLTGGTLGRRVKGTWELVDNATGAVVDAKRATVAKIPHLTEGGTFVHAGNEYALKNQQRLLPGVFTRQKENGEIESHVSIVKGGPSHRYFLDPARGVFHVKIANSRIPMLPLLRELGVPENQIRDAWGPDLYAANYARADPSALGKLQEKFTRSGETLKDAFNRMELDPAVTSRTLGHPHRSLTGDAVLDATRRILAVSRGEAPVDDRDHLAYQSFPGPEDMIAERIARDRAGVRRQLLFRAAGRRNVQGIPAGALQDQVDSAITESGLGQSIEELNPLEVLDKNTQISRMGEGGIPSMESAPDEARAVQPSHLGFFDPLRTPESERVGLDVYLANGARKGSDGRLYAPFREVLTGRTVWKHPQEIADDAVAFPQELESTHKRIKAVKNGHITYTDRREVKYELPEFERAFSPTGNLVPLKSMLKGQRVSMASRMLTQALPLANPQAPWLQSGIPGSRGTRSFDDEYGAAMGAIRAASGGRVVSASPDQLAVRYDDGRLGNIELYNQQPYARKTGITQTPVLSPGDRFAPGQLLARSNFTDANGTAALGLNARTAFMPWGGRNHEDAIVISESMAKRLTSSHLYQHELEPAEDQRRGKNAYISLFPSKFKKETLDGLDDRGVARPGEQVHYGDPLILAANPRASAHNKVHKRGQAGFTDASVLWDHSDPGIVTDVFDGANGPSVTVATHHAMQIGDKLSGRSGNKGVVSAIVPDAQMPMDSQRRPMEVLLDPGGLISRTNPVQWAEIKLGAIAEKTGQPFKIEDFDPAVPDRSAWVRQLMKQYGVPDTEDMIDPSTGRKIPGIHAGSLFVMKLAHMAEDKGQGRGGGAYDAYGAPAKGGYSGSKRLSVLDSNALLASGGTETLRDAGLVRGQKNEDYWLSYMQGHVPRAPEVPAVYRKFVDDLKAAGVNVVREGGRIHVMALTDKDIDQLAGDRNLANAETVKFGAELEPIKGGLFDPAITGGHHGGRWSALPLAEPMPNPVMEDPIRHVLGLTKKKFEGVIAGTEALDGETGTKAIAKALAAIDLDRAIVLARVQMKAGSMQARDDAVRRLGYLKNARRLGIHPAEWMLARAPVLPPQFRPISVMGAKNIPLVADSNFLYRDLFAANRNLAEMTRETGEAGAGPERLAVYHAFKAVTGLGDPITQKNQQKNVKGILHAIFGSSPKFGAVQRRLISTTVDNVGRAVLVPNPDLDMDEAGLPEDAAFDVYSRFVVRRLRRAGMPITRALQEVKERTPLARKALSEEMQDRPVLVSRAPVLHKFGIMALRPRLTAGAVLEMSPLIFKGYGADADGDMLSYHVPTDDKARQEALDRLLPSRQLLSPADFKTPVHMPGKEYQGGLFWMTDPAQASNRPVRTFRNLKDARAAWKAGDLNANDRVRLLDH